MNWDTRIQRLLACLGEPSRFKVLEVLADGDQCVTEVARRVGLSQSCTTRHLQALLREEVVVRRRDGKRVLFRIADSDPRIAGILEWALLRGNGSSAHAEPAMEHDPAPASNSHHGSRSRLPVAARRSHAAAHPLELERPSDTTMPPQNGAGKTAPAAPAAPPESADLEDYLL